jgi:hypothetical protein
LPPRCTSRGSSWLSSRAIHIPASLFFPGNAAGPHSLDACSVWISEDIRGKLHLELTGILRADDGQPFRNPAR